MVHALLLKKYEFSKIGKFSFAFIYSVFLSYSLLRPTAYDGIRQFLFLLPFFIFIFIEIIDKQFINLKIGNILKLIIISVFYNITQFGLKEVETCLTLMNLPPKSLTLLIFVKRMLTDCASWPTRFSRFTGKSLAMKINNSLILKNK